MPLPARSVSKIEPDQHRLAEEIAAVGSHSGRAVAIVLGMQGQVGPSRMMNEVADQQRMGIDVVIVLRKGRVALAIVSNEIVPIGKKPEPPVCFFNLSRCVTVLVNASL